MLIRSAILAYVLAVGVAASALAQQASNVCSAAPAINVNQTYSSSSINATSDIAGSSCGLGDPFDVWYRFTAVGTGTHFFTVRSNVIDPTVSLFDACNGNELACDDDSGGGTDAEALLDMAQGQSVRVRIAANALDDGAFTIRITGPSVQPVTGACCRGSTCAAAVAPADCTGPNSAFTGANIACNAPDNSTSPCCKADFNHVAGITVQDIFDFLIAYFAGNATADINGVDGITVGDIFAFLIAYFANAC